MHKYIGFLSLLEGKLPYEINARRTILQTSIQVQMEANQALLKITSASTIKFVRVFQKQSLENP